MRVTPNNVLIKPDEYGTMILGGKPFYIDTTNEAGKHAVTSGTVVAVCEKLIFDRSVDWSQSCLFDTDIEIKKGDRVVFHPLALQTAKQMDKKVEDNYLIRYDDIFIVIRGEEIIAVNGSVIAESVEEKLDYGSLIIPDNQKGKKSMIKSVVRYCGKPLRGYHRPYEYGNGPDAEDLVKPGDVIVHSKFDAIPLQHEFWQIFENGKVFHRMHYKDIEGVLENA